MSKAYWVAEYDVDDGAPLSWGYTVPAEPPRKPVDYRATLDAIRAEIARDMAEAAGFVGQQNKATAGYDQGLMDGFALSLAIIDRHMKEKA